MKIASFGCSITFGTELSDITSITENARPSQLTWPALIAKQNQFEYFCGAHGGSGNLCIMDRVLHCIDWTPSCFFIINWTFIDRFDYSDPQGCHFNNGTNDYRTMTPGNQDAGTQFYYKHLHSEYRDKLTCLTYIKTTLNLLKKHRAKFLMTSIDDLLWCDTWHISTAITMLQKEIRPYFYDFEGMNFLDWSRHHGFSITQAGHPLEAAHAAAAQVMWPNIDAILHRV